MTQPGLYDALSQHFMMLGLLMALEKAVHIVIFKCLPNYMVSHTLNVSSVLLLLYSREKMKFSILMALTLAVTAVSVMGKPSQKRSPVADQKLQMLERRLLAALAKGKRGMYMYN